MDVDAVVHLLRRLAGDHPDVRWEVHPVSYDPSLSDVYVDSANGQVAIVSVTPGIPEVQVLVGRFMFEHLPEADLGDFLAALLDHRTTRGRRGPLLARSLTVSSGDRTWEATA